MGQVGRPNGASWEGPKDAESSGIDHFRFPIIIYNIKIMRAKMWFSAVDCAPADNLLAPFDVSNPADEQTFL